MFKSKLSRLFCLLFSFLLLLASFGVSVSAASDNLISSDLTTWTDWSELQDGASDVRVTTKNGIYRVTANPIEGYSTYLGVIFDHSSLIAGHSYSLSFKMPNLSEINTAFNESYTQSILDNHFNRCIVQVGVGFISSSGLLNVTEDLILFQINSDNYTNFFGKSLSASFIAPNYSGTPVVYISVSSLNSYDHSFYFSNFKLVDNDDNSAELTGIKGFLHSIRWDLVGGVCSEDDCPHSSSDNPHLSLTERMSSGFASMFQSIGDKFEEGSTLNTWFTNLANKVGNVDSSISDLGDREEGFFSGLGDKIKGFFGDLGDDLDTWFDDLKKSWDQWIDDIQQTFDDVGASIENKFQEISDGFTEFFDKFKPRVYINFEWVRGLVNETTGRVEIHSTNNLYYVIISEPFTVSSDMKYILDYKSISSSYYFLIHQYDLSGNYIGVIKKTNKDFTGFELPSGYIYRFRTGWAPGESDLSPVNDYVMVYADEGWVNALLYNMKMGIKSLFVPDEAYLLNFKEETSLIFSDNLGFIYDISIFISDFLEKLGDLLENNFNNDFSFTFPGVEFYFLGYHIELWDDITLSFDFLNTIPGFNILYNLYKMSIHAMCILILFAYAQKIYEDVLDSK